MTDGVLRYDEAFEAGSFGPGEGYRAWMTDGRVRTRLIVLNELLAELDYTALPEANLARFSSALLRTAERALYDGNAEPSDGYKYVVLRRQHADEVRGNG